jgi:hypothetical protein
MWMSRRYISGPYAGGIQLNMCRPAGNGLDAQLGELLYTEALRNDVLPRLKSALECNGSPGSDSHAVTATPSTSWSDYVTLVFLHRKIEGRYDGESNPDAYLSR